MLLKEISEFQATNCSNDFEDADHPADAAKPEPQLNEQSRSLASSYQSLLKRPKQRLQRNYLSINREAARLGYASLRQASDYRALGGSGAFDLHGSLPPAYGETTSDVAEEPPARQKLSKQLPVPMTYGMKTQTGDPLHELLSNRYFTEWQQSRFDRHSVKSAISAVRPDFTQPTMTRAALLRQRLAPVDSCSQPLPWRLARFERSARPQLDTFRTEKARQAAVASWRAEQSHRLGPVGLGICAVSKR